MCIDRRRYRELLGGMTAGALVLSPLFLSVAGSVQDPPDKKFYEVTLSQETTFTFDKLAYSGDYFSFSATGGSVVTGTTALGVTVVIVFGESQFRFQPPKQHAAGFQEVFQSDSVSLPTRSAYIRLHPDDFKLMTKDSQLVQSGDEEILSRARALFEEKFKGSYHAGALAIIPPVKTFFLDMEVEDRGHFIYEEGDYLRLIRVTPYKSIFPPRLLNPKRWG